MSSANDFTQRKLTYRETKMFCPAGHGIQPALTITEEDLAMLECGCTRPQSLPLHEGRVSVEHLGPFSDKRQMARRLFPGDVDNERTAQRKWWN